MTEPTGPACFTHMHTEEFPMTWTTPKVTEIAVGMEINCYACAEIAG